MRPHLGIKTQTARRNKIGRDRRGIHILREVKKGGQQGGKTGETTKTRDQTFRNTEKGFDQNKKNGTMFKKTKKFCIAHQNYGHATDDCSWLKGRLNELPPPPIYTGKGKGDKEVSRETNRAARPLKGDYSLLDGWAGAKGDRG